MSYFMIQDLDMFYPDVPSKGAKGFNAALEIAKEHIGKDNNKSATITRHAGDEYVVWLKVTRKAHLSH